MVAFPQPYGERASRIRRAMPNAAGQLGVAAGQAWARRLVLHALVVSIAAATASLTVLG
jgi:hypothetical protein